MKTFFLLTAILNGTLAMAQGPSFNSVQRTTGTVGITPGQTARLSIMYPTVPAPILQVLCSATVLISDSQGKVLKSDNVSALIPGTTVSLDVNADTELAATTQLAGTVPRIQIHGTSIAANACQLVTTLEIIDNITQKTTVVVQSDQTYPVPFVRAVITPSSGTP